MTLPDFPNVHKQVFLGPHLMVTADCIKLYLPRQRKRSVERFADQLPPAVCYEGVIGLLGAYRAWVNEERGRK